MRLEVRLLLVSLLVSALSIAQQDSAELSGSILDPQGRAVAGALVSLQDAQSSRKREQTSDNGGAYRFPQAQPGAYTLRVEAKGFAPQERTGLTLSVRTPAVLNVTLSVGSVSESVTVEAMRRC